MAGSTSPGGSEDHLSRVSSRARATPSDPAASFRRSVSGRRSTLVWLATPRYAAVTMADWTCPDCRRAFTRTNQRHACGTGKASDILRNRPPHLVALYRRLEAVVRRFGAVEFVTRERYALLRTRRIFTDLVVMSDALRIAIHLGRRAPHPLFFKVAEDRRHVTHVAKIDRAEQLDELVPFLREAYEHSLSERP